MNETKQTGAVTALAELTLNARNADCRYCRRYSRRCGRAHTERSRRDWGRGD